MANFLYDVYLVYGGDRNKVITVKKEGIIASSEEDAKIKSGIMKDVQETWDSEYLKILCIELGEVRIKEKTKTVKIEK